MNTKDTKRWVIEDRFDPSDKKVRDAIFAYNDVVESRVRDFAQVLKDTHYRDPYKEVFSDELKAEIDAVLELYIESEVLSLNYHIMTARERVCQSIFEGYDDETGKLREPDWSDIPDKHKDPDGPFGLQLEFFGLFAHNLTLWST